MSNDEQKENSRDNSRISDKNTNSNGKNAFNKNNQQNTQNLA